MNFCVIFIIFINVANILCKNEISSRNKRYIIFPSGASYKLVIGSSLPLSLPKYQSVVWVMNMQFIHPQITNLTQIEGGLPPTFPIRRKRENEHQENGEFLESDRSVFYKAIESMMEKHGVNGRQCLLRTICENALYRLKNRSNGVWGEVLDIILRPDYEDEYEIESLQEDYLDARRAGEYGIDCLSLYNQCPLGHGILDIISVVI